MNYNILGYIIYLLFTFTVILYVGQLCYRNGKIYSLRVFKGDEELTEKTNRILLVCYYLFNLGYCLLVIYSWQSLTNWRECIETVALKAGAILISLGILHLSNMGIILYIAHHKNYFSTKNESV